MPHHRPRGLGSLALALALVACDAPRGADFVPSDAARTAPPPRLAETAMFGAALGRSGTDSDRIEAESESLAARAAALRTRADALAAPVIDPAARERLEQVPARITP